MLTRNSPNVMIEIQGNKKSKITVTKDHMIRIKVGEFIRYDHEETHIQHLINIAEKLIDENKIIGTLRGSTTVAYPKHFILQNDSRTKTFRVDL